MLNINGSLQVVPLAVNVDTGSVTLPIEDGGVKSEPAVILGLETASGPVSVVIPADHAEKIGNGIIESSQKASVEDSGLEIVSSVEQAEKVAQAQSEIDSKFK